MKKQLKDVCEGFTKNIAQKDLSENNGKYPIFGASGIIKTIDFYISDKPYIGIVKDGSGVGRTNKYPAKSSLLGTMQYILPNQGIDLDYLMYGIRSLHLGENYSGAAIPHIYFKVYKNRTLDFPELAEQKQRSIVLNKIQDAINVKEKQLFELENIIQSKFVEIFGDLDCNIKTIEQTCTMKSGTTFSKDEENDSGEIFYIKVSGMNLPENDKYIKTSLSFVSRKVAGKTIIPANSIIFPKRGGAIGTNKKRITEQEICIDLNTMAVTPSNELNIQYLYQYFQNLDMGKLYNGSTVPQINNKDIGPLKIKVPPLELQQQFAAFVQKIDKSKFVLQQQLQFIKKYVIMTSWRKICFYTTVAM
ncbi:MAG: restriction endonuclease subunit S [Treponema succinifaciens]|uniref:restriction endonuclease subunit S n=1 Tax=Treponema succinifaciens TaxID=167 RepID=UPI002353B703|nr:restriction endonuclease subunit S [Treponema succinifaciens]MCI6913810.1 restriction endonuclease subunit S [Treponema succinifaciens]